MTQPALTLALSRRERGLRDEGKNQASDGRRESRRASAEKFYWRSVAPTRLLFLTISPRSAMSEAAIRLHIEPLAEGTLRVILREAGIGVEDFLAE